MAINGAQKTERLELVLTPVQLAKLRAHSEEYGISVSSAVRLAIDFYLKAEKLPPEAIAIAIRAWGEIDGSRERRKEVRSDEIPGKWA